MLTCGYYSETRKLELRSLKRRKSYKVKKSGISAVMDVNELEMCAVFFIGNQVVFRLLYQELEMHVAH